MEILTEPKRRQAWVDRKLARASITGRFLLCIALSAALLGCAPRADRQLTDVSGHLPDLKFSLVADSGNPITAKTFQGKLVLMYFGFTSCVKECPVTIYRLSQVFRQLGQDADRIRVLFVTVDPQRDTAQALHYYLRPFGLAQITGMTGNEDCIRNLAKRYRAAYRSGGEIGDIAHSATVYIFDTHGRALLLWTPQDTDKDLAHDLTGLLHER